MKEREGRRTVGVGVGVVFLWLGLSAGPAGNLLGLGGFEGYVHCIALGMARHGMGGIDIDRALLLWFVVEREEEEDSKGANENENV